MRAGFRDVDAAKFDDQWTGRKARSVQQRSRPKPLHKCDLGGNLTFGVPINDGRTWLRLSLDGFRTVQSQDWPQEGTANYAGAFRLGFGRLL